ncbi:MAG: aminotransferase class I/II-fold pyridoxal phosphate-dependent enzyme [Gemmatimonadales bacterium]
MTDEPIHEETLDPADWGEITELGHRMLDDVMKDLATIRERPVWKQIPPEAKAILNVSVPRGPQGLESVYAEFRENVEPYALGNRHPSFWGWVIGSGTATGVLGDMLASAMNTNASGFEQSSAYVEAQVLNWFKSLFGFPDDATGILVTSGSAANLTSLTVARDAILPEAIDAGLFATGMQPFVYASEEVHNSVDKAIGVLGLGRSSLRRIRAKDDFTIDVDALRTAIEKDRNEGGKPICVVGTAGTVATGAIDDLDAIADICREYGMWFHVDGAFGSMAALSENLKSRVKGMERADSIAFDLHKWLYVNFDAGCVLVRNPEAQLNSFSIPASYLSTLKGGVATGPHRFGEMGVDLSRGFRALKAWMSFKTYGIDKYAGMVEQNVAQAGYLAALVEAHPELELVAPAPLNVVCFRFKKSGVSNESLDALNEKILIALQEEGLAVPSGVRIRGKFALRVANVNHRSRREDFDALVKNVVAIGNRK